MMVARQPLTPPKHQRIAEGVREGMHKVLVNLNNDVTLYTGISEAMLRIPHIVQWDHIHNVAMDTMEHIHNIAFHEDPTHIYDVLVLCNLQ